MPVAVTTYEVALWIHVLSALIAFGGSFTYPLWFPLISRAEPRALPAMHELQEKIGTRIVAPAGVLLLAAGLYMTVDGPWDFGDAWISIGMLLIIVLMGLGGAFFTPTERRLGELARHDVEAAGEGPVRLSPEYLALLRRYNQIGWLSLALVALAIYVMVVKPGA